MEEFKNVLEEIEQSHKDLRKIKQVFKSSFVAFGGFYENMQEVLSICNPKEKWCRNDEFFVKSKKVIMNYMKIIQEQSKSFMELHADLKYYGNNFKEFKKAISSKIKLLNKKQNSFNDNTLEQTSLASEITMKLQEYDRIYSNSFKKLERCLTKKDFFVESSEKIQEKNMTEKAKQCLTPVTKFDNESRSTRKFQKSEDIQLNRFKKISFENQQMLLLNLEGIPKEINRKSNECADKGLTIKSKAKIDDHLDESFVEGSLSRKSKQSFAKNFPNN